MDSLSALFERVTTAFVDFVVDTPGTIIGLIALAIAMAAALALHSLIGRLLRRLFAQRPFVLVLLGRTRGPSRLALVIFVTAVLLPALPFSWQAADWTVRFLGVVFVVLLGWIALTAVDLATSFYLLRFRLDTSDNLLAGNTSPRCASSSGSPTPSWCCSRRQRR